MRALQILQTLMLTAMLGLGAWIGNTTVESARAISRMDERLTALGADNNRLSTELLKLWEVQGQMEHRVTVIEGKVIK